jgi:Skp family chaperone for outer membrane proteins
MKKIIIALSFVFFGNYICIAQAENGQENGKRFQRIEAIKIAYITRELDLSPEESQKFWPLYNNYSEELKKARQENANDEIAFEEKSLTIRKKYRSDFGKVLGNDQRVNKIFMVERRYQDILRNELMNRQKKQAQKQKF